MADHTRFTLALLQALIEELPGLRTFVFVDGVADVTRLLSEGELLDARALLLQPGVVVGDGHSDYGRVVDTFAREQLAALSTRTTLVILGDSQALVYLPHCTGMHEVGTLRQLAQWIETLL